MIADELRVEATNRALYEGVSHGDAEARRPADLALVTYFSDERPLRGLAGLIDWRMGGRLSRLLREGFCRGDRGEAVLLPGRRDLPSTRIVLFGLGPEGEFSPEIARHLAEKAVAVTRGLHAIRVLFALPGGGEDREIAESLVVGLVEALGGELAPGETPRVEHDDVDAARPPDEALRAATVRVREASGPQTEASVDGPGEVVSLAVEPSLGAGEARQAGDDEVSCRWWIIGDGRNTGRLRRLLDGPPRRADT